MRLFKFCDSIVESGELTIQLLDFRVMMINSDWLPDPLCSHGCPPPRRSRHAFVKDICGQQKEGAVAFFCFIDPSDEIPAPMFVHPQEPG